MRWEDYQEIGAALADAYPNANYMTVSDAELIGLVTSLPGFEAQGALPDAGLLSAVSFAWIAAVEGPDDVSPHEGAA